MTAVLVVAAWLVVGAGVSLVIGRAVRIADHHTPPAPQPTERLDVYA